MSGFSYSKKAVRRAGKAFSLGCATEEELAEAALVINDWRARHVPVLQSLFDVIGVIQSENPDALLAGRIKKFDTIVDKLRRRGAVKNLDTMYDVVGCRIIFPNLSSLEQACDGLSHLQCWDTDKSGRHDYLSSPKLTGYRGRHLVFTFQEENSGSCLNAELQLRTSLQHAWATAVEMYDMAVEGSRLKYNEIDCPAGRFFAAASELIWQCENKCDPGSEEVRLAIQQLHKSEVEGGVLSLLESAEQSVSVLDCPSEISEQDYCLVDLNVSEQCIVLTKLPENDAVALYFEKELESSRYNLGHNLVLIKGATLERLEKVYPNYFGNISAFTKLMREFLA